uniref:Uncharacterized protein n=1 Tax=Rangifer tarandus platyrhynchus TaxID=3082113 RepID=A0ACB0FN50_RANTA|nr:unnamed protein product [Rangifer tarandus platyrhynchus]
MSMPGRTSRDQRTGFVAQTERELGRRGDTASRLGSDGREEQDWAEAGAPVGGNFTEQWAVGEDPCLLIQEEDMGQSPSQAVREGGACGYQGAWKDPDLPMMMAKLAGSHLYPPDLGSQSPHLWGFSELSLPPPGGSPLAGRPEPAPSSARRTDAPPVAGQPSVGPSSTPQTPRPDSGPPGGAGLRAAETSDRHEGHLGRPSSRAGQVRRLWSPSRRVCPRHAPH